MEAIQHQEKEHSTPDIFSMGLGKELYWIPAHQTAGRWIYGKWVEVDQVMPKDMQEDINRKIEELKVECGEWGQERHYKYLLEESIKIDIEIEQAKNLYQYNIDSDGDYGERACLQMVISKWQKLQKPLLQEIEYMLRPRDNQITPEMLQRAREYPITNLIEFVKGKTKCISGTHEDKNPSMSYKPNFVHCFSCGYHADSIKVAMQVKNLSFVEAVKWLAHVQ